MTPLINAAAAALGSRADLVQRRCDMRRIAGVKSAAAAAAPIVDKGGEEQNGASVRKDTGAVDEITDGPGTAARPVRGGLQEAKGSSKPSIGLIEIWLRAAARVSSVFPAGHVPRRAPIERARRRRLVRCHDDLVLVLRSLRLRLARGPRQLERKSMEN